MIWIYKLVKSLLAGCAVLQCQLFCTWFSLILQLILLAFPYCCVCFSLYFYYCNVIEVHAIWLRKSIYYHLHVIEVSCLVEFWMRSISAKIFCCLRKINKIFGTEQMLKYWIGSPNSNDIKYYPSYWEDIFWSNS